MWLVLAALLTIGAEDELPAPRPLPNHLDGEWTLAHLEIGGREMPARGPRLLVRNSRLILSVESADLELLLAPNGRVHRWSPTPGRAAAVYCPCTPKQWAQRFGTPVVIPRPGEWVIDPLTDRIMPVPPMPCRVFPAVPPSPGPEVGLYVASEKQLMIQLLPADPQADPSLILVLRREAAKP
jgi:hypothetical protein